MRSRTATRSSERDLQRKREESMLDDAAEVYMEHGISAAHHHLKERGWNIGPGALQSRFMRRGVKNGRIGGDGGLSSYSLHEMAVLKELYEDETVPPK